MGCIFKPEPLSWDDIEGGRGELRQDEIREFISEYCYHDEPADYGDDEELANELVFFAEAWERLDGYYTSISDSYQTAAVLSLIDGAFHDSYPIEVKRQTIKDSVKVHRKLGTKYAVETALGAVFPGAKVEEWFEYGGKPYFFRIAADVPESGVTAEQQRRILERVHFYKNLRSHLDGIEFQTESTGFVRVGAFVTAGEIIEIWPELTTKVEVAGRATVGGMTSTRQAIEVFPELTKQMEITGQAGAGALTAARQTVEVFPELAARLEVAAQAGTGGAVATRQVVDIFPESPGDKEETQ